MAATDWLRSGVKNMYPWEEDVYKRQFQDTADPLGVADRDDLRAQILNLVC